MFSSGQFYFALFFLVAFIIGMIYAYRGDIKKNPKYFKGSFKILISFIVIYGIYFILTRVFAFG